MQVVNSTFNQELAAMERTQSAPLVFTYRAEFVCGNQRIGSQKILSSDNVRDYRDAWTDDFVIECVFPIGTFYNRVMPFKSNLRVALFVTPVDEIASGQRLDIGISSELYRATILTPSDQRMASRHSQFGDEEKTNQLGFVRIKFQLQSLAAERFRTWLWGSNFHNCVPGAVVEGVLSKISDAINIQLTDKIKGVTMWEPNNKTPRRHVILPANLKAYQVPDYIQNEAGGVYSAGFSFYLQNLQWYVWPTFDFSRFNRAKKSATFLIIAPNQRNSTERTWRQTERQIIIAITGGAQHLDTTDQQAYNFGVGTRFAKASQVMSNVGTAAGNKFVTDRGLATNEYNLINRGPNLQFSPVSERRATDNVFRESSEVARRAGGVLMLTWQNSQADLLDPDMPCRVMYADEDGLPVELEATLLETHTQIVPVKEGLVDQRYNAITVVKLFVQKDLPEAVQYYNEDPVDMYTPPKAI